MNSLKVPMFSINIRSPRGPTGRAPCRARHAAACCAVAGVVYALGGFDGQSVLGSVERYEPTRGGRCFKTGSSSHVKLSYAERIQLLTQVIAA